MCGITGYYVLQTCELNSAQLRRSLQVMNHRGPDDEGITLVDPDQVTHQDLMTENSACCIKGRARPTEGKEIPHRIGFGHRRFSIVDVSAGGHQPLWSSDGKVCVAFNGEIYNYVELRQELKQKGFRFCTASDTEVLAVAYRAWGTRCFERFNGFWALSLYDRDRRQVLLARDRIGKAPLYVTRNYRGIYWASEIKGVLALINSSPVKVNEQAVVNFVRWHRRDLFHETFYEGINTFPNAAYAWIEPDGSYEAVTYWRVPNRRLSAKEICIPEAKKRTKELLVDSVRLRLRADVPVAVQVSGGMDSSALLAIAATSSSKVHAYTVAYPGSDMNEEPYARQVAQHYKRTTDYSVIEPPADDLLDHADNYIHLMGEPFHSPNQFTSYRIWKIMTRDGFRATLYGAGGDEVFAGYAGDYFQPYLRYLLKRGQGLRFIKEFMLFSQHQPGRLGFDYFRRASQLILPEVVRVMPWAPRLYHIVAKNHIPPECDPFVRPTGSSAHAGPAEELPERMIDYMGDWLMNYWVRIDNQNSMGVPIELRLPFLDYRIVEFGFRMPLEFLIRDGWLKWLLRSTMEDLLPDSVVWRRRKMGFPFPLKEWLGRFKDRILSMIQPLDCPYLDMKRFRFGYDAIRQHDTAHLWCLISLAMWWKRCVQGDRLASM